MLIPFAHALAEIARQTPVAARLVASEASLGLVVAATIAAPAPLPPVARARRPGFAVRARDLLGAAPENPAVLSPRPAAVVAGATLPGGADAVLDPGWAYDDVRFEAIAELAPGAGARLAGQDAPAGAALARPGEVVTPARLMALASAGVAEVDVAAPAFRLGGPWCPAALFLVATLRGLGCRPAASGEAPDLDLRFDAALTPRLALEPGAALALHFEGARARLALAPTPEAAAGALALLLPLVARWTHRVLIPETRLLTRKLVSAIGLADVALLAREAGGWRPLSVGDAPLAAILAADAIALIDPASEGLAAGAPLAATPLAAPLAADLQSAI